MNILNCHIENFGILSDKDFDFHDGINCFYLGNGQGKTTLAAFIRVMLFGFDNSSKRDDYENERKRFRPWNQKTYGGSMTVEEDGKRYLIAKIFGERERDDRVKIIELDTNLETDRFGANFGESVFDIDSNTYENTACILQNQLNINSSCLMHYLDDNIMDDNTNYSVIQKSLKDAINHYSPDRKTGQLYKDKSNLIELKQAVKTLRAQKEELTQLELNIHNTDEQLYDKNRFSIRRKYYFFVSMAAIFAFFAVFIELTLFVTMPLFLFTPSLIFLIISEFVRHRMKYPKNVDQTKVDELVDKRLAFEIKSREYNELRDKADNYFKWEEEYEEKLHNYELLRKTKELADEAYVNYITRISSPLKDRFDYYINLLDINSSKYTINGLGEIDVYENSMPHKIKTLSEGKKDIINLAMRFSFIDLMFKDKKPVIIMDDPFVNLDDDTLDMAIDLINGLDSHYQILYFTCASQRSI